MSRLILLTLLFTVSLVYPANLVFSQNALSNSNDIKHFRISDHDTLSMIYTLGKNRVFFIEEDSSEQKHVTSLFELGENNTSFPDIELHSPSNISIFSGCDICGSNAVVIEYKIINRQNKYIIAGYTRTSTDRTTASVTICDVNFLSGKTEITKNDVSNQVSKHTDPIDLSELSEDFIPDTCVE